MPEDPLQPTLFFMRLNDYLRPDLILTDLQAADRAQVIAALSDHLSENGVGDSSTEVRESLREREEAHTTVIGRGVALPHATIEGLAEPVLMVAVSAEPVQFGPPDTDPVKIFFVLVSPPGREREHIKLLARICRLVKHPGVLDSLREAGSGDEILSTIRQVDEEHV